MAPPPPQKPQTSKGGTKDDFNDDQSSISDPHPSRPGRKSLNERFMQRRPSHESGGTITSAISSATTQSAPSSNTEDEPTEEPSSVTPFQSATNTASKFLGKLFGKSEVIGSPANKHFLGRYRRVRDESDPSKHRHLVYKPKIKPIKTVASESESESEYSVFSSEGGLSLMPKGFVEGPHVSQTDLIQSIGRPFNHHQVTNLAIWDKEFKTTRRVSRLDLHQIKNLIDDDTSITEINRLVKIIKSMALIIGVIGLLCFILLVCTTALTTPMEYLHHFLGKYTICNIFYITGTLQPFAVAPYCTYTLVSLKEMRGYMLRVPISLILPFGVIISSSFQISKINLDGHASLHAFLIREMILYNLNDSRRHDEENVWHGIQSTFRCCGYDTHKDWEENSDWVKNTNGSLPSSCCTTSTECSTNTEEVYPIGCKSEYITANVFVAMSYFMLAVMVIIVETMSVILVRRLYFCIRDEVYDERSNLYIIGGKICSLCDIENEDEEDSTEVDKTATDPNLLSLMSSLSKDFNGNEDETSV